MRLETSFSAVGLAVLLTFTDSEWSRLLDRPNTPETIGVSRCISQIALNEQIKPYDFFGSRANDAGHSLRQRLLVTSDFEGRQKRFTGQTDWHIEWRACYESVENGCRIGGIISTVNVTYTLPRWADRNAAPANLRERWDRYIMGLTSHEKGHGEIAMKVAGMMQSELVGITDTGSCNHVGEASTRIVEDIMQRGEALQRDYDRMTAHGTTQGAQFPF